MEEINTQRKTKLKHTDTENPQSVIANVTPQTITPEIPQEVSNELSRLIQDLLLKAHELSFEYSTMECQEILVCPLAKKAKELFRIIKQLSDLSKKMTAPPKTQYIS